MSMRIYRFRLYPTQVQELRLLKQLTVCKNIYNHLLQLNIQTYSETGHGLFKYDFNKLLTSRYPLVHSQVRQNVSDRVHKAMQNFFRRVKDASCKKKGFPRFKSLVHSLTYPQTGFKFLSERRLKISKIGSIPIVLHRALKGKVKTLTIKRNRAGQWYASFACEIVVPVVKHKTGKKIGIDVGLKSFATLSNGKAFENPRCLIRAEGRLKRLQRGLSRKKKGSRNRVKAKLLVARQHLKISNQRRDFLHKLSHTLTKHYGFIAVEGLQIKNMVKNHHLAKHISDASWNAFIQMLSYKAVICGGQAVKVNPRGTSKICSGCGETTDMPRSKRWYKCASCGLSMHRDHNSAINILHVGLDKPEFTPRGHCVRPLIHRGATVVEAGTIHRTPHAQ